MKKTRLLKVFFLTAMLAGMLSCSLITEAFTSDAAYFPMRTEDGVGLMDCEGEWVVEPLEKGIMPQMMVDGVAPYMNFFSENENQVGIMDKDGVFLLEDAFYRAFPYSDGLAAVHIENMVRFVDQTGAYAFEDAFPFVTNAFPRFENGLANVPYEVRDNGTGLVIAESMVFIDKEGNKILGPYLSAFPFSNGYAAVTTRVNDEYISGFIDDQGAFVLQFSERDNLRPAGEYADGLFPVRDIEMQMKENVCAIGFMNQDKEWVIEPQYCRVGRFSDGLAAVAGENDMGLFEFGFIDTEGKTVIKPQFTMDYPPEFRGGCTAVAWDNYNGFGLIDTSGKMIYEFER
mgnify:CR=1 FL=1